MKKYTDAVTEFHTAFKIGHQRKYLKLNLGD